VELFIRDDDVDVVGAAEAVVEDAQEAVAVRGEVDAHDFGGFVGDDVEEAWVLVGETVVIWGGGCQLRGTRACLVYVRGCRVTVKGVRGQGREEGKEKRERK